MLFRFVPVDTHPHVPATLFLLSSSPCFNYCCFTVQEYLSPGSASISYPFVCALSYVSYNAGAGGT